MAGVLSDFGCSITPGSSGRIRPIDVDICLSILDYASPPGEATPTRALNILANRVVRTVCVGSDDDLQVLHSAHDANPVVVQLGLSIQHSRSREASVVSVSEQR